MFLVVVWVFVQAFKVMTQRAEVNSRFCIISDYLAHIFSNTVLPSDPCPTHLGSLFSRSLPLQQPAYGQPMPYQPAQMAPAPTSADPQASAPGQMPQAQQQQQQQPTQQQAQPQYYQQPQAPAPAQAPAPQPAAAPAPAPGGVDMSQYHDVSWCVESLVSCNYEKRAYQQVTSRGKVACPLCRI